MRAHMLILQYVVCRCRCWFFVAVLVLVLVPSNVSIDTYVGRNYLAAVKERTKACTTLSRMAFGCV